MRLLERIARLERAPAPPFSIETPDLSALSDEELVWLRDLTARMQDALGHDYAVPDALARMTDDELAILETLQAKVKP